LQAFTTRLFMENSLNIAHPDGAVSKSVYSAHFLGALQNVCAQFPPNSVVKVSQILTCMMHHTSCVLYHTTRLS
jgi:hypothetical protein